MQRECVEWVCRVETERQQTDNRQATDRHHRWRIRIASGSKQAARATPTARSACFVPHPADQDFTQHFSLSSLHRSIHFRLHKSYRFVVNFFQDDTKRAPPKTLYINNINN